MIQKLTKATTRLLAILFAMFATTGAWADFQMTNPVTCETETYANKFTGTNSSEWNDADNWNTSKTPFISDADAYSSALVDGMAVSTTTSIDGWNLQVGAYNGASITWNPLGKIQGDSTMWLTVDGTSSITINGWGNGNLGQSGKNLNYYVAAQNGVTWGVNLASGTDQGLTMNYYLAGNGSVSYQTLERCAHVIKMADVTLSGTPQVVPKTLVSFTSTTKTFTADAAIKVYGTDGSTLKKLVGVTAVRQSGATIANTSSALTTADAVGSCEIVQCTDGIALYYVDGDPDTIAAYKPSININFTNGAANGLTTTSDVGLEGYAVPGTAWNNFVVANNTTYSTVNAVDSTGVASVASGVSVTVSGTRGHWNCSNLTPASNPLHGYIDESSNLSTPTVTITGIPYDHYRVIVYHSTDQNGAKFGYDTINGFNFTYVDGVQQTGTTSWGSAGASNSAEAIAEGVNTLVSAVLTGDTVTMVAHRIGGDYPSARGCFAAIQVVEYVPEVGEDDLEIAVDGATSYPVDEAKTLSGTVYLTGSGTLTLTGSEKITAATIDVGSDVVLNINADRLDATTFTGSGTVVYDTTAPVTGKGWADIGWSGTVWVKNVGSGGETSNTTVTLGSDTSTAADNTINNWGNANSRVKFTNVRGHVSACNCAWTLVLEDDGDIKAWYNNNGWTDSNKDPVFAKLAGDGTFYDTYNFGCRQKVTFTDASEFTGTFNVGAKRIGIGGTNTADNNQDYRGTIEIVSGAVATIASGKTWTSATGFRVNGTLNVDGTLSCSESTAVSGSGTVVFTGRLPTPTGDTWWKNTSWTGTVQIDSLTGFVGKGSGTVLAPNDYGNTGSTLELKNCSGWLPVNYECSVPLSIAGTLTIGNGYSDVGNAFTIDHLKGSGQITCNGSAPTVLIYVREWSGYTGKVKMDNKMIVFGADTITENDLFSGTIYICEGAVVTNRNASHWEPAAKMKVNGTFAVTSRAGWTDSKPLELGANGVVNFIGSGVNDNAYNFSNITGSGKILFSNGTGYSMLPSDASRMPSTDVAVVNDNTASFVVLTCTGTTTIGTLSGSGKFDSRYGTGTTRRLAVVQSADSEWSGTFVNEDRVGGMDVSTKSGATAKTLTLSGTQTASNELVIQAATETTDAGSVNLTGTWVGATTVAGTFGGTGTLTGNLTFNAGSTFKAFASDENGLAVSGTVTYPAEGKVTVDVSALTETTGKVVLMTAANATLDVAKFALASGQSGELLVEGNALKVDLPMYAASYGGTKYPTVQEAIDAAVADGHTYEDVTILDETATCPAEYYIDTEDNDALKMYQAAIVQNNAGAMTTNFFKTAQLAVDAIEANVMTYQYYTHFEVYSGTAVAMTINPAASDGMLWTVFSVKVKCLNSATVAVTLDSTESELTAGDADSNGIVTYTKTDKATTYVWAATAASQWGRNTNWKVGTSEGATATRYPGAADTVIIGNGANVTGVSSATSVAALQVSGTVTIVGGGSLTSASAITLGASDSITITGTLSPTPTTNVVSHRVKTVTSGDTTTYSVEAIPGTTFTVY